MTKIVSTPIIYSDYKKYAKYALAGLLANGSTVSYDTARQSFEMALMMVEMEEEYTKQKLS